MTIIQTTAKLFFDVLDCSCKVNIKGQNQSVQGNSKLNCVRFDFAGDLFQWRPRL
jgi:hypothetical protein